MRLLSLVSISDKAYKATAFDGTTAIIPKSQVYGRDWAVMSSESYWISSWILNRKHLTYSTKKIGCFNEEGRQIPFLSVEKHIPIHRDKVENIINDLKK